MYSLFVEISIKTGDSMLGSKSEPQSLPFNHTRIGREIDGKRMVDVQFISQELIDQFLKDYLEIVIIGKFKKDGLQVGIERKSREVDEIYQEEILVFSPCDIEPKEFTKLETDREDENGFIYRMVEKTRKVTEYYLSGTAEIPFKKTLYKKYMNDIIDLDGNKSRPTKVRFCHSWAGQVPKMI